FDTRLVLIFFFFQAEDGIRDFHVTGVQTCALPIWSREDRLLQHPPPCGPCDVPSLAPRENRMKRSILAVVAGALLALATAQAPADTYVYMTFGEPVTMDPARAYDTGSGGIIENVYETLFIYDGAAIDQFVPNLATDYSVSDDGATWTFQLRDGVQFHSGNTLSCKDVEYSFQYGALVAHPEGAIAYLMGHYWRGTQIDASDPAAFEAEVTWEMVDSIVECPEGPDGLVAQVNLVNPTPALIPILTYPGFSIIDSQWAIE